VQSDIPPPATSSPATSSPAGASASAGGAPLVAERRFRALQEASPDGFLVLRGAGSAVASMRCAYANEAASRLLGLPVAAEADLGALWPGVERSALAGLIPRTLELGERTTIDIPAPRSATGAWFRCTVMRLSDREVGLEISDVTARRRGDHALAIVGEVTRTLGESLVQDVMLSKFVRALVPSIADVAAIHLRDPTGRVRCVAAAQAGEERPITRAVAHLFRMDDSVAHGLGAVLGGGIADLLPQLTPEVIREIARDDAARAELEALGTKSWIGVPLSLRGEVRGALTLERTGDAPAYDLGDRFLAEELARRASAALENAVLYDEVQRASALKDDFLSIASHELRTPLSTILGWAKLLIEEPNPPMDRVRKGLEVIQRNALAQARLVDEILDTSRILRNRITLDLQPVPVRAPVLDAIELVQRAATERRVQLDADVDPGIVLKIDRQRVRQALFQLISNAVKFSAEGGTVTIRASSEDGVVSITVRDEGAGIDPSYVPHLFDRFRQADASSTRKHGGLGLGLAMARRLAELHGGMIEAHSDGLGRGATFTLSLPDLAPQALRISQPPRPPKTPDLAGTRVLLVDDHDDARELYGSVIAMRGARVTLASSAAQARARILESTFDVLVSDIAMPYEDGVSLVLFARAHAPRMRTIAMSAYARPEDVERASQAGFERYLVKPVDTHELARTVAELARGPAVG
jgi:signal transduction histidine kinase